MNIHPVTPAWRRMRSACVSATFALVLVPVTLAQTQPAETNPGDAKPAHLSQTFFLSHVTEQREVNDILTDLRNMLPHAHSYAVSSDHAVTVKGSPEDIAEAQKLIADFDKPRKAYRLNYTINERDGDKQISTQRLSLIVLSGERTVFKQGSRVPIVTGSVSSDTNTPSSQVQYLDVGLNIEASVEGAPDDLRLQTRIEQSGLSDEKSGLGALDPVIRQTQIDGHVLLSQNKPLLLGSLDIPGTTRREEVSVVGELVR